jgi:serine/threonine-protein kinase
MRDASDRARVKQDPLIGQVIQGRFRVLSKIGEGGMGSVYKGEQISISRPVAIKTLLRQLVKDEKFVRRFQNEALAVSKLAHPNTIRIIDFGQLDEGVFYIVMELLLGLPLQRVMRTEKVLAVRRVLRIIEQAARSLSEAHAKGIVHRDLKPDNIFLCTVDGDADFVKVLDFGVAKMVDDSPEGRENITQTAMILGTPKYMSPEQGMTRPVDGRSDLYALGVMAYEALVGRAPFVGEPMALLYHHVHTQPVPPSELRPDIEIPADVEALVLRLLAKDPSLRFANGDELAAECQRLRNSLPPRYDRALTRDESAQAALDQHRQQVAAATRTHAGASTLSGTPTQIGDATRTGAALTAATEVSPAAMERRRPARWKGVAVAAGIAGLALGGAVVALKLAVEPLPAPYQLALAEGALAIEPLDPLPVDAVTVRLESRPVGAEVWLGDTKLGAAPLAIERLRGQPTATYAFRFPDEEQVALDVDFDEDGHYVVELPKKPEAVVEPPKSETPVAEVEQPETPTTAGASDPAPEQGKATEQPAIAGSQSGKKPSGGKKPPEKKPPVETNSDTGRVDVLK